MEQYVIVSPNGDFNSKNFSFDDMTSNFKSHYGEVLIHINDAANPENNLLFWVDEEGMINKSEPNNKGTLLFEVIKTTVLYIREHCPDEPIDNGYRIFKEKIGVKRLVLGCLGELIKEDFVLLGAVCISGVDNHESMEIGLKEHTIAFIREVYDDILSIISKYDK